MKNKIILEFSVLKPKAIIYRGVQAIDGSYRMEKRGINAKKFKSFMWTGSVDALYWQQKILLGLPTSSVAPGLRMGFCLETQETVSSTKINSHFII